MTTSHSVHDYPEHLNPFSEDDNHNKIRFWTIGRKMNRSNSINFSGIKELKNSWAFRSFMKKGKKGQQKQATQEKQTAHTNGNGTSGESPVMFRRNLQYSSMSMASRSTVASPERYVYGGSVTPLPRSRFQERLRSASHHEVNGLSTPRLARSEVSGSRLSVESTNPFDEPVAPARRRKKKRAPAPPGLDVSATSETSELHISEEPKTHISEEKEPNTQDVEIEEMQSCSVELKIIEDAEVHTPAGRDQTSPHETLDIIEESVAKDVSNKTDVNQNGNITVKDETNDAIKTADSIDNILKKVSFPKVNISTYRRNSSVNEDDVRLRRGNLEDFHPLSTKRSKSLTNDLDTNFVTYDINLNESIDSQINGNEPQRVVCKLLPDSRKQSIETISSTEKEFIEIDKATREFEMEISKLTSALHDDDVVVGTRLSVSDIRRRFDGNGATSPNPIPKPRRSHYGGSISPINGNYQM